MKRLPAALSAVLLLTGTALAQERPVLTVYTYSSFVPDWGPGPRIREGFEAICDCTLNLVGLDDGVGILNRLRLEGESTQADVALGMTTDLMPELKATGLFAPSEVDLSDLTIPGGFDDEVFVPFDYSWLAFIYDSQAIENPPTSFAQFVESFEEPFVIQDARTSTPGLGLLLWVKALYGDEAGNVWRRLSDRILTVTPGWSEAYGLFTSCEAPAVLSYTTSPAYHRIEEGTDRYRAMNFEEGHYTQVEIAGRLAGSDQPELARQFLEYMLSQEAQSLLPVTNWTLPVVDLDEPLPDAFAGQPERAVSIDPEEVAANRAEWTREWLAAIGR